MKVIGDNGHGSSFARLCARASIPFIILLSWMPGAYILRSGILPGQAEHFIAYLLSAVFVLATHPRLVPAASLTAYILLAGVLEIGQNVIPGRHPAVVDFLASSGGAMLGAALVALTRRDWYRVRGQPPSSPKRAVSRHDADSTQGASSSTAAAARAGSSARL